MLTDNFIIQHTVRFNTNKGYFNEQPIFVLSNNRALTGGEFLSVVRLRESNLREAASGVLAVVYGSSGGLQSATGTKSIYPESTTADNNTSTASNVEYVISTVLTNGNRVDVIVNDTGIFTGDISLSGLTKINNNLNYLGAGYRPGPDQTPPDGTTGKSQILLYTYNREELNSQLTGIEDRSGNSISANIKGVASGDGTISTISGFTYSPCEGGFRLDGKSWIESLSSGRFHATTAGGFSMMTHIKLSTTGTTNIMSVGSGTTEVMSLKEISGTLQLKVGTSTLTAGFLHTGEWYHIGATVLTGSNDLSGAYIYINGNSAAYTNTISTFPNMLSNGRLVIGKDLDLSNSGITGMVGLTRIFNRALSGTEFMLNYLGTIPSLSLQNSLQIG
jgi:hypothetical protein